MRGPYTRNFTDGITSSGSSVYYCTDLGRKTRVPLPYSKTQISTLARSQSKNYHLIQGRWSASQIGSFSGYSGSSWNSTARQSLYNQCYSRFISTFQEQIQVAVSLAEWRQTVELGVALANALRRPVQTFGETWNRYQKASRRAGKTGVADEAIGNISDAWLAFQFGIKPLIGDLHSAAELFTKELCPKQVHATASRSLNGNFSGISGLYYQNTGTVKHSCRIGALITVTNPNLYYANQLGLLNPASIAWELVPFSFLVDWFVNVGQMIGSMSDMAGVSVSNAYYTHYRRGKGSNIHWGFDAGQKEWESVSYTWVQMDRTLGLPIPKFRVEFPRLGFSRFATATALLGQMLHGFSGR